VTDASGDRGARPPARAPTSRHRAGFKPVVAAAVVVSPLLLLVLFNAAALIQAYVDPASTCWLDAQVQAGRRVVYPFEIHLLFFAATIQFWAPILLLMAVLFWYVEWIRLRELLGVAALSAAVLYLVGVEYQWMADLYRERFDLACV
jgi:hypothetical protein